MQRLINLALLAAAALAAVGGVYYFFASGDVGEPVRIERRTQADESAPNQPADSRAYITGAVSHPGLYQVEAGDRLADLIERAGGPAVNADLQSVNLALRVYDQQHWVVPSMGAPARPTGDAAAPAALSPTAPSTDAPTAPLANAGGGGRVDVNSASAALLATLPGIGQTRADSIIRYREEHGPFQRLDDITSVDGIGKSTLEAIRDLAAAR